MFMPHWTQKRHNPKTNKADYKGYEFVEWRDKNGVVLIWITKQESRQ